MKNFLQVNRASTGAKKNFRLVNRVLKAKKNFNLNQIKSNPDGEPTVNRQSRLMSHQGKALRNVQMSRYCPQPDSVSSPCRCRDLATPRVSSAVFSARAWKYVAMIFAVLMLSIANIGMAWGENATFTMSTIFDGTKTTASVSSPLNATVSTTTSASNADDGKLGSDNNYFAIVLTDKTFSAASINGYINTTDKTKNWAFQFTTNGGTTWGSEVTQANDGTKTAHDINVDVTIPSGANGIRIIRKAGTSTYVHSVTLTTSGGVTRPTFSPATGSSLVKSTGTVTLTSSGNTVFYKWSTNSSAYAASAGSTLAGAADGSGTSSVNATAPSTAGTWYLYAVAKNGSDYSDVVKATYTITNPTHALKWNLDGGTASGGTAAGAVAEGATLTAPTVTKVGYDFAGWSPAVPSTMPSSDATYTATWTKVYVPAGASYNFVNQGDGSVTWGSSSHTVTLSAGTKKTVPAGSRVDNIFFSTALDIEYEKDAEAGTGYKGWKIKQSGKLAFYVENDCDVIVTNGIINGMKIHYYNQSNVETNTNLTSTTGTREETAHVKGGTLFEIISTTTNTNTLKGIRVSASCTNPTASWSTAPVDGTAGGNMNASLTTNYAAGVVYSSSNPSVATVSGNGTTSCTINYVAAGSARITATVTGDGSTICAGPATCCTDITVSAAAPSTKRIYMKAGAWNNDSPKFFIHSWGDSDNDVQMTAVGGCEDDVFYADIPSGNTSLIFTRQNPSTSSIIWDGSDLWNRTDDISISSYDLFTFATWDGGPSSRSTFTGGTYSAPTYTISFAGNGNTGGSMSSISSIACEADQTVTANAYTKTGYSFTGWKADVDVKVSGSTKTAGTLLADGVTIQDISSNITLTAQWEAAKYTVTYNVNGEGSVTPTSEEQASSGASVTLPTPTWSGYTFEGWYNAGNKIGNGGASYTPTADITLYAHWTDNISGKVFSFIDNNYGDKFKAFDLSDWVTGNKTGRSKTYTNGDGVQYVVTNGGWDSKSGIVSLFAKFFGGTTTSSVVIPTGKKATVKILYGAYGTGDDYRLTVNGTAQSNPVAKLTDDMTSPSEKCTEVTLDNQTGTLTLGISNAGKNLYVARVSAVITGYTVSYAAGTYGSGSLDSGTKTAGSSFTLSSSSNAFTRSGYVYDGWSKKEDGSTKDYDLGGSYTTDAAITLYPHWVADCVAPATVNVAATVNSVAGFQFYPGDAIELTATPTGSPAGSPVTYQWANGGEDILGATSSTYSVVSATTADAGKYTCTISYGACSTTSAEFGLKCMQFYLKNSSGEDISNHALEKVDATHATLSLSLTGGTTYKFRVTDGCGDWYGNTGEMTSSNCTNWAMDADADCRVTTSNKSATYTFNFDFSGGLLGSEMKVSVVYPSGDQPAGKIIYWDNSVLNWEEGKQWYRIGKSTHNNKTQMTLVSGTANLYKITTTEYNGFEYWHIANNDGNGDGNIFWTKGEEAHAITAAMGFEGSPVTADAVTFTPTSSHATGSSSDNDNCEFYEYSQQNGMKTDRVTISDYSNGTITVNYTNTSDEAATLTSGSANLAHTVILTSITAVADEGYDASAITINGGAYSANYVVTGATTVAASFTPHVYNITLNMGDHGAASQSATVAYLAGELTSITHVTPNTGYTLTGYYDGETKVLNANGTFASANVTGYITDSKWTKTSDATLTAKWTPNSYTLTWDLAGGTTTSAGTGIASGVSSNTMTSQAFGTALTAPTVTKANYDFSAWSPSVASTMPAANTTYTATWTAQTHDVSFSLTNAAYSSGTDEGEDVATYGTNYSVTFAAAGGFVLPSTITVTIGGDDATSGTEYTWDASTGTLVVIGSYITGDIAISFAAIEEVYTVEYAGNGNTGGTVPTDETAYHPDDEVMVASGVPTKSGSTFVGWLNSTNNTIYRAGQTFTITDNTTLTAQWSTPTVTTYYYGQVTIKNSALEIGISSGKIQFFTNTGGTIASSDAISLPSPTAGSIYYYSNNLSDSELSNSSNWSSSSSSGKYIQGLKFANGTTYTLALGTKVATSIKFYGWCGSESRTMTVGGQSFTSSSNKKTFETHDFTKSGNFTGDVSITQNGDFYGILVITTSTPSGYDVTFNASGKSATGMPSNYSGVPSGKKIAAPIEIPTVSNFIFDGWVTTSGGSTPFNFASTAITSDKTIYAKWIAKTSPGSGTVSGTTNICSGSNTNVTLSTSVSGASYQLYKDNVASGVAKAGTGSALTWSVSEEGVYTVKAVETATHASGNMSGSATISIYTALSKTSDPTSSKSATVGEGCALDGLAYTGNANVACQWQTCTDATPSSASNISDGGAYSNCTTSAMTFTPASTGTYYFRCVVSDDCGSSFNSGVVTVTAKVAPNDYTLSGTTSICSGDDATLTLSGSDYGVTYKLYKGGVDQSDDQTGDGNELTWTVSAAGTYTVKSVADVTYAEATMSGSAVITVTTATSITSQPATSPTAHDGVSVTLGSGMAVAGASISYKWYSYTSSDGEGEAVIADATSPTYAVTKSVGTYYYKVEVIGTCGSVKSDMITLTVDNKHLLTYNANGGSGAPSATYVAPGSTTLSNTKPTKTNYRFLGWNTKDDGTGDHYDAGASYTMGSTAVTLYAEWGETATLTWTLTTGTGESSVSTSDKNSTNDTRIAKSNMSNLLNNGLTITNNSKSDYTVKIEAPSSKDDDKYMYVTFVVADDYEIVPSAVTATFRPVDATASADMILSDTHGHSISLLGASCSKGNGNEKTITNGSGVAFTGAVTLKIYCYGSSVNTYRLGSTITITGAINYICPERPTIVKPASAKALNVYADESKTLSVEVETYNSGALTYQWKKDGANIADANSATYTVVGSTLTVGTTYAYTCDVTEEGACASVTSPAFNVKAASPNCGWNVIIGVTRTSGASTEGSHEGVLYGSSAIKTYSDGKIGGKDYYFGLTLKSGYYFQNGDKLYVNLSKVSDTGPLTITAGLDGTGDVIGTLSNQTADYNNEITLSNVPANTSSIVLYRTSTYTQNPYIDGMKVKRYTCPDSKEFLPTEDDGNWNAIENWIGATGRGASLPTIDDRVIISKPVVVNIEHATAKSIVIYNNGSDKTGKLTIQPNKGLEVDGTIQKTTDGSTKTATGEADLVLESSSAGNASLIFNNSNSCAATVQMYSKAGIDGSTWNWQYVGTPFTGSIPLYNYYGSWMYKWDNGGWAVVKGGDELDPFAGYCLTQSEATTHVMGGTLVPTTSKSVTMAASTDMVLANSWTAPISIASFDIEGGDATFTSTPATIYLFNTGSAKDGSSEGTEAGTYIAVPINSAPYTGNGLIAPMQGFFVTTNGGAAGTITMNYNDLVRPSGEHTDIVAGSMKAPKRIEERPEVMKIRAEGSVYNDRVVILSREDFSQGFDNGWDGKKMSFGNASPSVYVINEEGGYDAVSAIPEYEGTVVGFRAGTDSEYTIRFEYDGEEMLYLNDLQEQEATPIDSMRTYTFTAEAGDNEARFIISTTPIQKVITDIDPASDEQSAKVRKVIINDHIYIIRGGRMYSVDGALVVPMMEQK